MIRTIFNHCINQLNNINIYYILHRIIIKVYNIKKKKIVYSFFILSVYFYYL